jgi:hypothetical protein
MMTTKTSKVLDLLSNKSLTTAEIASNLCIEKPYISQIICRLKKNGRIYEDQDNHYKAGIKEVQLNQYCFLKTGSQVKISNTEIVINLKELKRRWNPFESAGFSYQARVSITTDGNQVFSNDTWDDKTHQEAKIRVLEFDEYVVRISYFDLTDIGVVVTRKLARKKVA